ncbi:MAG TPA: rod shape-determining protein MreC [Gaiellales bacterium]|jgi:rod shape-determining protein MreC|nr:rod shape-determining protein MreC [Gaiellales bacterium]
MTIDRVIRRRILLGLLLAASFGLLTAWYREVDNGPLHRAQGSVADAAVPVSAAVQRVARPFRDLWEWSRGLANARDEAQRLQKVNQQQKVEIARLQQQNADRTDYRTLLAFTRNPRFSGLLTAFVPRGADVIERPVEPDAVRVLIDAGKAEGVAANDAVIVGIEPDRAALVGIIARVNVHSSVVTLLTSPDFAVGASVPARQANGIVRPSSNQGSLELDDVQKRYPVQVGDVVSTSGWQDQTLGVRSRLPAGLPIGLATQVNDPGDALVKVIQVTPLVDLDAFSHVLVLTARAGATR